MSPPRYCQTSSPAAGAEGECGWRWGPPGPPLQIPTFEEVGPAAGGGQGGGCRGSRWPVGGRGGVGAGTPAGTSLPVSNAAEGAGVGAAGSREGGGQRVPGPRTWSVLGSLRCPGASSTLPWPVGHQDPPRLTYAHSRGPPQTPGALTAPALTSQMLQHPPDPLHPTSDPQHVLLQPQVEGILHTAASRHTAEDPPPRPGGARDIPTLDHLAPVILAVQNSPISHSCRCPNCSVLFLGDSGDSPPVGPGETGGPRGTELGSGGAWPAAGGAPTPGSSQGSGEESGSSAPLRHPRVTREMGGHSLRGQPKPGKCGGVQLSPAPGT